MTSPVIYPESDGVVTRNETYDGQVGDPSIGFDCTKAIRPDQFDAELCEAMNWGTSGANIVTHGDPRYSTPDNPSQLWCCRSDCNVNILLDIAAQHVPNPNWQPTGPPLTFNLVKSKAANGGQLNSDEIQVALIGLLANAPTQ